MQEVAVKGQPLIRALFGVKLRRKNIIPCNRRCEASAIVGFARSVARIRRLGVETVYKVEISAIRDVGPQRMPRLAASR